VTDAGYRARRSPRDMRQKAPDWPRSQRKSKPFLACRRAHACGVIVPTDGTAPPAASARALDKPLFPPEPQNGDLCAGQTFEKLVSCLLSLLAIDPENVRALNAPSARDFSAQLNADMRATDDWVVKWQPYPAGLASVDPAQFAIRRVDHGGWRSIYRPGDVDTPFLWCNPSTSFHPRHRPLAQIRATQCGNAGPRTLGTARVQLYSAARSEQRPPPHYPFHQRCAIVTQTKCDGGANAAKLWPRFPQSCAHRERR